MNTAPQKKSYILYTSLFNKVCAGPLLLVLAALTSAYFVYSVVDLIRALGNIPAMIIPGLSVIFSLLSTIAFWLIYTGARKNNIAPAAFTLATMLPKFVRFFVLIFFVAIEFLAIIMIALVIALADEIAEFLGGLEEGLVGMVSAIGSKSDAKMIEDLFEGIYDNLLGNTILVCVVCVVMMIVAAIAWVRFGQNSKFLKSVKKMYKTGHMVAAPSMFIPVCNFIMGGAGIVLSCWLLDFSIYGILYSLMSIVGGILVLQNREELASIYSTWQAEIGMNVIAQETPAPASVAEAPVAEAPVAEAPTEKVPAEEAPAEEPAPVEESPADPE